MITEVDELKAEQEDAGLHRQRESDEKYRTLFNAIDEGFCIIEMIFDETGKPVDYRFLEANPAFTLLTGLSDAIGKRVRELAPEHGEYGLDIYAKVALSGKSTRFERKSGANRYYEVYAFPAGIPGCNHVAVLFKDITEKKAADNVLQENERKYQELLKHSPAGICEMDFRSKRFTSVNDVMCQLTGYSREELLNLNPLDILDEQSRITFQARTSQWLEGVEPEPNVEYKVKTKDGRKMCVLLNTHFTKDEYGKQLGVTVIGHDITEQRKMEEELQRHSEELQMKEREYLEIIDSSSEGSFIHDVQKGEIYYSPEWQKRMGLEGLSAAEALHAFDTLVHPDDSEYMHKAFEDACKYKAPKMKVEFRAKTADSQYIWILCQAKIIYNQKGRPIKYFGTHTDITRRKEMEWNLQRHASELDKKNRLVTEFFTNISHEFKTPLSVILIQLELMNLYLEEPAKLKEFINAATQNSYRLNRLVANLLDVTKIDAGYMKAYYRPADMVETISGLVESVRGYADTGIEIEFKSKLANLYLPMDCEKMERVMLNLLSNAIKHTQKGGHIQVGLKETKNKVLISVKDDGEGIPDEKKNVIFDRFQQVNTSLTRNTEGTGIGLSLTKALIELMQGRIWFTSRSGKGTEFFIELPILNGEKLARLPQMEGIGIGKKIAMEFADLYLNT